MKVETLHRVSSEPEMIDQPRKSCEACFDNPRNVVKESFMPIRKNILVKGFVQGVSYRKQTQRVARRFGVNGWVRNMSNGDVEACLEGEAHAVDAVIAWCAFGPTKGKVDEVQILDCHYGGGYSDFCIWKDRKAA